MKNIRFFLSENFMFWEVKFSIYLNRRVFVMEGEVKRREGETGQKETYTDHLYNVQPGLMS